MRIHNTNISERSSYVKIISRIKPISWTGLKDREKKRKKKALCEYNSSAWEKNNGNTWIKFRS